MVLVVQVQDKDLILLLMELERHLITIVKGGEGHPNRCYPVTDGDLGGGGGASNIPSCNNYANNPIGPICSAGLEFEDPEPGN